MRATRSNAYAARYNTSRHQTRATRACARPMPTSTTCNSSDRRGLGSTEPNHMRQGKRRRVSVDERGYTTKVMRANRDDRDSGIA